jgi:drug/metabolite transporter (DMT)-like permease
VAAADIVLATSLHVVSSAQCRIGQKEPALVVALWFHCVTIALMVWPLLLGLPEHAELVAPHDCLLLLGIAASSFFAQLLMTRSFQIMPAAQAAAVSFTGA